MADKNESKEPRLKKQYKQPEENTTNLNSAKSARPATTAQNQKSQSWFSRLFRPVKKQELVVTQQKNLAQKQGDLPDMARDLQAAAMVNKAAITGTSMMVDGKGKEKTATAKESLTAKESVTNTKSEGLAKGKTSPMAAQELQTKQSTKQSLKVDEANKVGAKSKQGALAAKQQLTAKESVTQKASLQKGSTVSETKNLAASKMKLSAAQKLKTNEKLASGNIRKPPVKKSITLQDTAGKRKIVSKNGAVTERVNLTNKKPKKAPVMPEVTVGTNSQGQVNVVNINAFSVPQPSSQAVKRGYKSGQTQHKTARVISASKKKINNRNENKDQNLSFQVRR